MTRIIGGLAGGRRLAVPPKGTRPTTDRVRESLFNILTSRRDLAGLAVLDLYAGSGALGLEALSRGAASALFIESDARAAAVLKRNISTVGLPGAILRRAAVGVALGAGASAPVDLVMADPPYSVASAEVEAVMVALSDHGWVQDGTLAVIERPVFGPELDWPSGWCPWESRVYGDTRLELAEWS